MTGKLTSMAHRSASWLFRNRRTGEITIAQFPNPPLWIFILCVVADRVLRGSSTSHRLVAWLAVAALTWWALDEVIRGVNPWRRFLGLAGAALVVAQVARLTR